MAIIEWVLIPLGAVLVVLGVLGVGVRVGRALRGGAKS